jgi:hypothetical protein
MKIKKLK